ncbi:class I SAM-dependent methyltransferase [Synechococcus sp. BMK-MC-1]|uniref:class I SAM-dependent methyltransferase n=1 Tax=Synechococcus sp. BMK-MC-1 TaxID=1442551 RepID=UPI001645925D|nr:class I SAM-dependent methyltransferase [Synechococcus sp. BMK-MC-1]QNI66232.1 methyltransferase domain protein [Synechococcus sp. BMK-MC-1]
MTSPSLTLLPDYIGPSTWWQHVPIAHWLMCEVKPQSVVELGTHYGVSFFAFCEAAEAFSKTSFLYAVDTWEGDHQAGHYGHEVFEKVKSHADRKHRLRSRLIRSTFDDAAQYFDDQSIDLLHIDGLHTYAAVKHDYETWLPKLKENSIILFHDINVREREFGVWKLWDELKETHTTYETANGHGLGILLRGDRLKETMAPFPEALPILTSKGVLLEMMAERSDEGSFESRLSQQEINHLIATNKHLQQTLFDTQAQLNAVLTSRTWRYSRRLLSFLPRRQQRQSP